MKIKGYEYRLICEKCEESYFVHFPTSFTDYLIMRCNICFEERLISSYGKTGMRGFAKFVGLDEKEYDNVVFEIREAIEACAEHCQCGGSFLFVNRTTPLICSKCKNVIIPKNLNHSTSPEENERIKKEIEIDLLKWRGNLNDILGAK